MLLFYFNRFGRSARGSTWPWQACTCDAGYDRRPEAVEAGTVKLVGTDVDEIVQSSISLFENELSYKKCQKPIIRIGDGLSSGRIVAVLEKLL